MQGADVCETRDLLACALEHLRSALELLDKASAPGHIGSRVDHAVHELYTAIAARGSGGRLDHADSSERPQ